MNTKTQTYNEIVERYNMGMLTSDETIWQLMDAAEIYETLEVRTKLADMISIALDNLDESTCESIDNGFDCMAESLIGKLVG